MGTRLGASAGGGVPKMVAHTGHCLSWSATEGLGRWPCGPHEGLGPGGPLGSVFRAPPALCLHMHHTTHAGGGPISHRGQPPGSSRRPGGAPGSESHCASRGDPTAPWPSQHPESKHPASPMEPSCRQALGPWCSARPRPLCPEPQRDEPRRKARQPCPFKNLLEENVKRKRERKKKKKSEIQNK